MKVNLLLDMDGCIANFYSGFAEFLNKNYNAKLDLNIETKSYSLSEWGGNCRDINISKAVLDWISDDGFVKMPIYNEAYEFISELTNISNVFLVTARVGDFKQKLEESVIDKIKSDTIIWLKNNNIDLVPVFEHKKIDFCKENKISIMVEDKLETALSGAEQKINTVLIDRGWNKHPDTQRIYRSRNYKEAINFVRKLSNE